MPYAMVRVARRVVVIAQVRDSLGAMWATKRSAA